LLPCFKANQQSDGVDFIKRIICLAVPSSLKTLALGVPLMIVLALVVSPFVPKGESHVTAMLIMGFVMEIMIAIQFQMIYKRLRAPKQDESGPNRAT
jgi:hypothetical protein